MGKRSKSRSRQGTVQRDTTPIATHRVLRPLIINQIIKQQLDAQHVTHQKPIHQDRRRYQPARVIAIKTLAGTPARFNNRSLRSLYANPWEIIQPRAVKLCQRRKARREVLHALRRTGKGSRSQRKYSYESNVKC